MLAATNTAGIVLLVLGAINWSAKWYRPGGRASLDQLARTAVELFLQPRAPR